MDIKLKIKEINEVICHWIEMAYINNSIDNLVEYTDEVDFNLPEFD